MRLRGFGPIFLLVWLAVPASAWAPDGGPAVLRRDTGLIGGWVRSWEDEGRIGVEDLLLASNGEWLRRQGVVSSDAGAVAPPDESNGMWYTDSGTLILLESRTSDRAMLRRPYLLDDETDRLTLSAEGESGPLVYFRYR